MKEVDRLLSEEQAVFRRERSCTDQIATVRVIIEQSLEWNFPLYLTFIDFEKAYDSVDREALRKLLKHYGIPGKIARLIRAAYEPSTYQVVRDGSLTALCEVLTVVRQGCLLPPFLFLPAMDWTMKTTTEGYKRRVQRTLLSHLEDVDFADDVALLSHRHSDMEDTVTALSEHLVDLG